METLETATHWSRLAQSRAAVREALLDTLSGPGVTPIVMCHLSHAYETGASVYFTVLAPRGADPFNQWQTAKPAASAAITGGVSGGRLGTISNHHGIDVDHAPCLAAEVGEVGIKVLAAVIRTVDPTGILNPGKLIR